MATRNGNSSDIESFVDEQAGLTAEEGASTSFNGDDGGTGTNVDGQPATNVPVGDTNAPNKQTNVQDQQREAKDQGTRQGKAQEGKQPAQADKSGEQKPKLRPVDARNNLYQNENGDLTDGEGNLVAQNGFARRQALQLQRATARNQELENATQQMQRDLGAYSTITNVAQKMGLSHQEVAQAVDMAGKIKQGGVVEVAKAVIAMAMAEGHNATDLLGADVGDSVDMRAMREMLDRRFAPMENERQARENQQRQEATVQRAYDNFVRVHPYAELHQNHIVRIANENGIPLQQAYHQLELWAVKNGYDYTAELGPQVEARRAGQQEIIPPARNGTKPMPHGDTQRGGQRRVAVANSYDGDSSWADMIKASMAEAE